MLRSAPIGGHLARAAIMLLASAALACGNVTDTLLEATDPDLINPADANSAEGALALYNGTLNRFVGMTGGTSNGTESSWLFGGLIADEWSTSSTFVQNDETDQRFIKENNSSVTDMMRGINRVRTTANQAIRAMNEFRPTEKGRIAELYFARGYAELQLASDFCNGIPLSDGSGSEAVLGTPKTVAEVFQTAVASFDSALTLSTATDAATVLVNRAAHIGKARALVGLNQLAAAATEVAGIPTSYAYQHTFALASVGSNTIWGQGFSAKRYSVGDSLEGNGRNLLVKNVIPFGSANDPRLPVVDTKRAGQDGQTFTRTTTLYDQLTPLDVVNGIDARLIEAEAALRANQPAQMLTILNALRAAPPKLGTVQPAAMAPLTDPGTADARINLFFREKAFWTFSRGQRLGDLRRLIRQYNRTADNTFPTGVHYKGGNYGADVNLPVVTNERQNPNFTGCIDRSA